jgi:hypothetical protein
LQVIAYIRLCRPGSILGPQQVYLHEQQARMWNAGNHQGQPTASGAVRSSIPATVLAVPSAAARSRSVVSSQLHGSSSRRTTANAYTSSMEGASAALMHPASAGISMVDSPPSSNAAQLRRYGSMPSRIGSSFGASSSRSPSAILRSGPDSSSFLGDRPSLWHAIAEHCPNLL